jgi:hypothetical protein
MGKIKLPTRRSAIKIGLAGLGGLCLAGGTLIKAVSESKTIAQATSPLNQEHQRKMPSRPTITDPDSYPEKYITDLNGDGNKEIALYIKATRFSNDPTLYESVIGYAIQEDDKFKKDKYTYEVPYTSTLEGWINHDEDNLKKPYFIRISGQKRPTGPLNVNNQIGILLERFHLAAKHRQAYPDITCATYEEGIRTIYNAVITANSDDIRFDKNGKEIDTQWHLRKQLQERYAKDFRNNMGLVDSSVIAN